MATYTSVMAHAEMGRGRVLPDRRGRRLADRELSGPRGEDRGPEGNGGRRTPRRRHAGDGQEVRRARARRWRWRPARARPPRSPTQAYADAGATIGDRASVLADADIVLGVAGPDPDSLAGIKPGAWLAAGLNPFGRRGGARASTPMPRWASRRWRWSSCRASPARSRWTSCRRSRTSRATRRCSTPRANTAAPSR